MTGKYEDLNYEVKKILLKNRIRLILVSDKI
jgi:hypothetical protein